MGDAAVPGPPSADGTVLEGRYRLGAEMGRGGVGVVHRARDLAGGRDVAVKFLLPGRGDQLPRMRREVAALRLLRLLGVVVLLDEGVHEGRPYFVMEIAPGTPFPGAGRSRRWEDLAPVAERFLETLSRVHAAGVLHRDLKPSNVFVDDDGSVTILDFGLSWGALLGAAVTEPGTGLGTLEYSAPEQLLGRPIDARTDLYAAGAMLYEALTGSLPHAAESVQALIQQRMSRHPLPVRRLAPDVPLHVAQVVDELLLPRPGERPASAGETLRRLFGHAPGPRRAITLPRLGGRAALDALVAAARSGRSADVSGPQGSGRTRLLEDAASELEAEGRRVVWTTPGTLPFSGVERLAGGFEGLDASDLAAAEAALCARVAAALRGGVIAFADDADRLDSWSARVLEACRGDGAVVRVTSRPLPGGVKTELLAEQDLRALFGGPGKVLHLREDAASEMWQRTGGVAARVEAELAAWLRNGIVREEGGLYIARRAALNAIRGALPLAQPWESGRSGADASPHAEDFLTTVALAWPDSTEEFLARVAKSARWMIGAEVAALEADGLVRRLPDGRVQPLAAPQGFASWPPDRRAAVHRSIADALVPGSASRFRHLLAAGSVAEAADEAVAAAGALTSEGDTGRAAVILQQALAAVREAGDTERESRLLRQCAITSFAEGTAQAIDQALHEFGRRRSSADADARILELLRASAEAWHGDSAAALARLEALGVMPDDELELWRRTQRVRAASRLPRDVEARIVDESWNWAVAKGDARSIANATSWRARHLERVGRPDQAIELFLAAAESSKGRARIAGLLNAAALCIELARLEDAEHCAAEAVDLASRFRHPLYEARCRRLVKDIHYRSGRSSNPDLELIEAAAELGDPTTEALVCLTEAAVAWRAGDHALAATLAERSTRNWSAGRARWPGLLSRSLAIMCRPATDSAEIDLVVTDAKVCPVPGIAVQALGLVARAAHRSHGSLSADVAERASELPGSTRHVRRELISVDEAMQWAGAVQ